MEETRKAEREYRRQRQMEDRLFREEENLRRKEQEAHERR